VLKETAEKLAAEGGGSFNSRVKRAERKKGFSPGDFFANT
jgi:hypothetical protein